MRIKHILLTSTLALTFILTACSTNNEKKEEVNESIYVVEESKKTPLQLKMDSYEDYQEIDPNEEIDHKYLEQMKDQMVVHQFHKYTQFDDFGYINYPGTIKEIQKKYADSRDTVEYVKTLIVPTYFVCNDSGVWTKVYDNNQVVDGEKIFSGCPLEYMYTSEEELDDIFQNMEKDAEKQYRLNPNQAVQNKK